MDALLCISDLGRTTPPLSPLLESKECMYYNHGRVVVDKPLAVQEPIDRHELSYEAILSADISLETPQDLGGSPANTTSHGDLNIRACRLSF